MFGMLKTATLAAFVGLAAVASAPAPAQAEGIYFNLGGHDGPRFGAYYGKRHDGYGRHHGRRFEQRCSPNRALDKADRLGVRRAYVARVGPNRIRVHGRKYGQPIRLVFAREAGCPIIRW